MRCIKDEEGKVLVVEADTKERWQNYFCKLFNGKDIDSLHHSEQGCAQHE